jgi:HlyD family secretion protein
MKIKVVLWTLLICAGISVSRFMLHSEMVPPADTSPVSPSPQSPYTHCITGTGVVESLGGDTYLYPPYAELVTDIYVVTGQLVEKDAPLFKINTQDLETKLATALQQLGTAQAEVAQQTVIFSYYEQLKNKNAVSQKDYTNAYYAKAIAETHLGTALAEIEQIKVMIGRSTIRAPKTGIILQQNIHVGEVVNTNPFSTKPIMIFGNTDTVQIRTEIAEKDTWRITPGAHATAFVQGNSEITIPLTFSYIEPFMVSKQSPAGSIIERPGARVLHVIYTVEKADLPLYIGERLDVFIEAKPSGTP